MRNFIRIISIKKVFLMPILLSLFFVLGLNAQSHLEQVFTAVSVVNGKVVFQQFVHVDNSFSADQKYALLYKWGKDNYAGNPLLSGIRFDDKGKTITVSSKVELLLPENTQGVRLKMLMNYKLDASITNAGCMLSVRDITYQNVQERGKSFFPKAFSAEEWITDSAVSAASDTKELKQNTRKSTLYFLNELYGELNNVFALK